MYKFIYLKSFSTRETFTYIHSRLLYCDVYFADLLNPPPQAGAVSISRST